MSIPTPSSVLWLRALLLAASLLTAAVPFAAEPPPPRALQEQLESLLQQQGLKPEHVGLLLYSTRERKYLASVRQDQPLVAASNTKLVTTYIALRVLGPNYRWRTRLSLVEPKDVPGDLSRQGLLVEGSGDPTLTSRGLEALALRLRAEGVRRIDGPIYLDGSVYEEDSRPNPLPPESPAYIPLSPFVVDYNTIEFTITRNPSGAPDVLGLLPAEGARVVSQLQSITEGRSVIKVEQAWSERGATFTLSGSVRTTPRVHALSTAISQPAQWFYHWLRVAMRRVGIEGNPPLQLGAPENGNPRLVFSQLSPPLREAIVEIDKQSSNLGAEAMLRAVAQTVKPKGVTGEDGLRVARRELAKEFPGMEGHYRLADGSG
ncbi:MAG TPA: D-alanyl-D-alanine carboxypeptidase/D-alanyl-D-alanine-endopeptidase, partial [bacterium]